MLLTNRLSWEIPVFIVHQKFNSDIIVALSELHMEEKDPFIPGFILLKHKIRKTHKRPRISGGIAVFAKENVFDSTHM